MKPLAERIRSAPPGIEASIHEALHPLGCVHGGDLARAESWLRSQGCTTALGPMQGCTWLAYRANLGPHEEPPFHGEPKARAEPFETAGYRVVGRYSSTACDHGPQMALADRVGPALTARGWTLGDLRSLGAPGPALQAIHATVLDSFQDALAWVPIRFTDFAGLYGGDATRSDPELVLIARAPDGSIGGFCFCFCDPLHPSPARLIVKTLAVRPGWRRMGVGQWLVGEAHRIAHRRGYAYGVHALMWNRSQSQRITAHGGRVFRRYVLFGKDL